MHPSEIEGLEFTSRDIEPESGTVRLRWRLVGAGGSISLEECFVFGASDPACAPDHPAFASALDLLHWVAGVSYWKVACSGFVQFAGRRPDAWQADALERIYRDGLAELAWRNGLEARYWPQIDPGACSPPVQAADLGLARRALVPMGGGKDSLVALERVRARRIEAETVQVGSAPLIVQVAECAGTRHRVVKRRMPPELAALNAAGALNGHVPITAINAAALVVAALWWNFDAVVFANERSADTPTLTTPTGQPINHQFAKSLACEALLGEWIGRCIAGDLEVFSLLRRDRELAVCREFAGLDRYHGVFSSCNRNFHLDGARTTRWCGRCPKCQFVYLALAPFMSAPRLRAIFGADLLDDPSRIEDFAALLELHGPRPFECVGEAVEARAALKALADDPGWQTHAVVRALVARLDGIAVPGVEDVLEAGGPHRIPERFLA